MWLYDYWVWTMLNIHFMGPAKMIARNDAIEDLMKFSLNGIKATTICKP